MSKTMTRIAVGAGVLLTVFGSLWFLQGMDVVRGSAMSGVTLWAVVGPFVAIAGLVVLGVGLVGGARRRRTER